MVVKRKFMGTLENKDKFGPLKILRQQREKLDTLISELEKQRHRIIDVAYERLEESHKFEVLRVDGDPEKDKSWTQLERVTCKVKCQQCPHGDFLYKYYKRKDGSFRIKFQGEA